MLWRFLKIYIFLDLILVFSCFTLLALLYFFFKFQSILTIIVQCMLRILIVTRFYSSYLIYIMTDITFSDLFSSSSDDLPLVFVCNIQGLSENTKYVNTAECSSNNRILILALFSQQFGYKLNTNKEIMPITG